MIILDTNVISETTKLFPEPNVIAWLNDFPDKSILISAITVMELWAGSAGLPPGKRKDQFVKQNQFLIGTVYADRVLPFDQLAAEICGTLLANNRASGRHVKLPDTQIAAIALSRGFTLATRNIADFQFEGLKLVNPWAE